MKKKSSIYHLTVCALMAAVICVLGPMSLPIGPVPITLCTLAIYLTICLLGMKWATVSVLVYLLLGAFGLPVFSAYSGGLGKLAGPTGGYIVGYIFLALVSGFFVDRSYRRPISSALKHCPKGWFAAEPYVWDIVGMVVGTAVLYVFGTAWFMIQMQCALGYALTVCVVPFLAFDSLKIVIATLVGATVRTQLVRARLIEDKFARSKTASQPD